MPTVESPLPEEGAGEVILHARSITKRFGGLVAVHDAELLIPKGAIISLIGPNGAGKTTFFNIVAGILDPTEGEIELGGRKMVARPMRAWLEPILWFVPSAVVLLLGATDVRSFRHRRARDWES